MSTTSFKPTRLNLDLYAGDPASFTVEVSDAAGPLPITGEVKAQIRRERSDTVAVEFAVGMGSADEGKLMLGLSAEQTAALPEVGEWDVQWFPLDGEPLTLMQGRVFCAPDVTRLEA